MVQNKGEFAGVALEQAMEAAKRFPAQMQDFEVWHDVWGFIDNVEAILVLDELYDSGVFRPLKEEERVTSQLLMFADRLPG